jgi:hypothetical protein
MEQKISRVDKIQASENFLEKFGCDVFVVERFFVLVLKLELIVGNQTQAP